MKTNSASYYGNGKLLITGEYVVLDGALALALPTKFGQGLEVFPNPQGYLHWISFDHKQKQWLEVKMNAQFEITFASEPTVADMLKDILQLACELNPDFSKTLFKSTVKTNLTFNRKWGLGTSSTLIYCVSQWANVNPYVLLKGTFGGSGYDIACASAKGPITYQIVDGQPHSKTVTFQPTFTHRIYFGYLGQKQISKSEIKKYGQIQFDRTEAVTQISAITNKLLTTPSEEEFCELLQTHEQIIGNILGVPKLAEQFPKINGTLKSLGGWGGDMIMFIGDRKELATLQENGIGPIIPYTELIC